MSRHRWSLAALVTVALLGAGCSHGSADSGNPDTDTTGNADTAGSGADQQLGRQEKAVKFAECLRANGVPHFPDPDPDGDTTFGVDVTREVWLKAVGACEALKPPGALSSTRTPKQQSAGLRFAQCVREHGVKDFPDPVNGEPLIDTYKIPSTDKPGGMAILDAATQACGDVLAASAGGQG